MPAQADAIKLSLPPRSVVAEIVEALRRDLQNGSLAAGEAVRERELAERFAVSRTPAREAINRLVAEGLLTQEKSARGATVVRPTAAELQELYEIRLQLEPMAAALAAANASAETLQALAEAVDELDDCQGPDFFAGHLKLHLAISESANRPILDQLIENLRYRSDPYVRLYIGMGQREHAQEGHRRIVDALVRRDGPAAAEATREHLLHTIEAVRPFVEGERANRRG